MLAYNRRVLDAVRAEQRLDIATPTPDPAPEPKQKYTGDMTREECDAEMRSAGYISTARAGAMTVRWFGGQHISSQLPVQLSLWETETPLMFARRCVRTVRVSSALRTRQRTSAK